MALEVVSETDHGPDREPLKLVRLAADPPPQGLPTGLLEPHELRAALAPPAPPTPMRPVFPAAEVMRVIEALLKITGLRLLLCAAFGMTAWLGFLTVTGPTPTKITAFCLWCVLAFFPVVLLVNRKG